MASSKKDIKTQEIDEKHKERGISIHTYKVTGDADIFDLLPGASDYISKPKPSSHSNQVDKLIDVIENKIKEINDKEIANEILRQLNLIRINYSVDKARDSSNYYVNLGHPNYGGKELHKKLRKEWISKYSEFLKEKGLCWASGDSPDPKLIESALEKKSPPETIVFVFDNPKIVLENKLLPELVINRGIHLASLIDSDLTHAYSERLHELRNSSLLNLHNKLSKSEKYVMEVGPLLEKMHDNGKLTLKEKAEELMKQRVLTPRGNLTWDNGSVRNILVKWQELTGNKFDIEKTYTTKVEQFAQKMKPILENLEKEGFNSFQAKADELTRKNVKTIRGKTNWSASSVWGIQKKLDELSNH